MPSYAVGVAPSAERDIERIHVELQARVREGKVRETFPDEWFEAVAMAIRGLSDLAERHPFAPERERWGRDVRNVLLHNGYRILYEIRGATAWVLRVRHQRRRQLKAAPR